ncbi:hypothetical protein [Allopontixanthobacter sediminis]|uniref:Uncharacterized protein n=1 Tax=Allopontixanthobacter sediminis TaxID=1689985 RepID=A0A845B6N7_9SPHN|nr:hypothetical protein [Allopontixanthobacter sediminis]MXP45132.1 hypothetical protein [Allopontixanthobacter sediminis]
MSFSGLASVLIIAAASANPAAATPQPPSQPATAEAAPAEAKPEKMICHQDKVIGSRVSAKKVCKTASQWAAEKQDAREATEKVQSARWKSE